MSKKEENTEDNISIAGASPRYTKKKAGVPVNSPAENTIGERVAKIEGKLEKHVKTQEELYHERKAKYDANVAKRKDKDAKKAKFLADLEDQD